MSDFLSDMTRGGRRKSDIIKFSKKASDMTRGDRENGMSDGHNKWTAP